MADNVFDMICQQVRAASIKELVTLTCVYPKCAADAVILLQLHWRDGRHNLFGFCLPHMKRLAAEFPSTLGRGRQSAFFF